MRNTVNVLMATYNGEKYISEQLESILNQTYSNFRLFICDDGSTDNTIEIIKQYMETDDRIYFEQSKHLGACQNFSNMIRMHNNADYIMLCDQDDIWECNKICRSLEELSHYDNVPTLLYCDKVYVDESLNHLNFPNRYYEDSFKSLLCQCHIYGCTMMMNSELIDIIDIPQYASMHDHWISLIASLYGKVVHLNEPLILYRQHSGNVTGGMNQFSFLKKIKNWKKTNIICEKTINMCYRFCKTHNINEITESYIDIFHNRNVFRRLQKAFKFGYKLDHFSASVRGMLVLLFVKISD